MTKTQKQTKQFKVQIDQLCTIWTSSIKYIEANSQQEADEIALNIYNNGEIFENIDQFEYVYDSLKETETMEILNGDGNRIIKIN
jgi:archaellum component FlaF (FlaF/FlaG flagellin family)